MIALRTDELRALAEAVKEWNSTDVWPHEDCQYTAVIGGIDEDGLQYPIAEINADTYGHDGESLALANFYAAANPAVVLGLLDRIAELEAQQALKPLTPVQVKEILKEAGYENSPEQEKADFINGIRHGEIAHGITAAPKGDAHGQPT